MPSDKNSEIPAWTSVVSTIASALTVIAAIGALWFANSQIQASQQIQREASARDAFKEYLKLAMEHSDLADGLSSERSVSKEKRADYAWFISYFLFSAEQIYLAYPGDKDWEKALADQFCYHRTYLMGDEYRQKLKVHYNREFANLIDESVKSCLP